MELKIIHKAIISAILLTSGIFFGFGILTEGTIFHLSTSDFILRMVGIASFLALMILFIKWTFGSIESD